MADVNAAIDPASIAAAPSGTATTTPAATGAGGGTAPMAPAGNMLKMVAQEAGPVQGAAGAADNSTEAAGRVRKLNLATLKRLQRLASE